MRNEMDPDIRYKKLIERSKVETLAAKCSALRLLRSGREMLRMADTYYKENKIEDALLLYLRYATIFIEKIKTYPEYDKVSKNEINFSKNQCKRVLELCEKLVPELKQKYKIEYELYLDNLEKQNKKELLIKNKENEKSRQLKLQGYTTEIYPSTLLERVSFPSFDENNQLFDEPVLNREIPSLPNDKIHEIDKKPKIPSADTKPSVDRKLKIPSADTKPVVPSADTKPVVLTDDTKPILKNENEPAIPSADTKPISQKSKPNVNDVTHPSFDRNLKPSFLSQSEQIGNRNIVIPNGLIRNFMKAASRNTNANIETCGVLAGKLERDQLIITHVIVSKQNGTSNTCNTTNEEDIFDFQDQHDLITLGWIHTHPSQTAFLSSIDVHTQCSYQIMMPEAIAIVCAPTYKQEGIYALTEYGLSVVSQCQNSGFHSHPTNYPLFLDASHIKIDPTRIAEVADLR